MRVLPVNEIHLANYEPKRCAYLMSSQMYREQTRNTTVLQFKSTCVCMCVYSEWENVWSRIALYPNSRGEERAWYTPFAYVLN